MHIKVGEIRGVSCNANVWQLLVVEVDILELSKFLCFGVGICHTSIRLVLMMVKEIYLRLTQGMTERQ